MVLTEIDSADIPQVVNQAFSKRSITRHTSDGSTILSDLNTQTDLATNLLAALDQTQGDPYRVNIVPKSTRNTLEVSDTIYTDNLTTFRRLATGFLSKLGNTDLELNSKASLIADHEHAHLLGFQQGLLDQGFPSLPGRFLYSLEFVENPENNKVGILPGFIIIEGRVPLPSLISCYLGPDTPSPADLVIPNTILPRLSPHLQQRIAPTKTTTV